MNLVKTSLHHAVIVQGRSQQELQGVIKRVHGLLHAKGTGVPQASPREMILTRQSPSSISIVISV
ncbi:hypothetical protein F2Q69_00013286 [Brassica cretica]|uniref:Uncharacterized protein n=1 Tax=Brassica cretica TaxID=69181 RepID=A0A8S9RA24_BRACR|nr:hypothetical protein F2Q69_00013286 [Brassica cretica]